MSDNVSRMERALKLSNAKYKRDTEERIQRLKKEPKVGVYGNPLYREYLGDSYSFDFNDYPVFIAFDSKTYYFPKSIAEELQRKLDAAARGNTPKEINETIII